MNSFPIPTLYSTKKKISIENKWVYLSSYLHETLVFSTGFDEMYSNAQSFLRGARRDNSYSYVRAEQSSLFNWTKRPSALASWRHMFVCLSKTNADRVPTSKWES